jgi:peptide-methionine (S)-S-oxide reductase
MTGIAPLRNPFMSPPNPRPVSCSAIALLALALLSHACARDAPVVVPPPATDNPKSAGALQTAVLAGGCFWGVQGVFQHVRGIRSVVAGYAGGSKLTAHYRLVGSGATNHAEAVQITFDPNEVSYGTLLQIFFSVVHDPTQLNRQGPDIGSQYRSAIFFADEKQRAIAAAYIAQLSGANAFGKPIVTRVDKLDAFYAAEDYHQDFLVNNPRHPYIAYHDLPKLENFRQTFPVLYSAKPVLVQDAK